MRHTGTCEERFPAGGATPMLPGSVYSHLNRRTATPRLMRRLASFFNQSIRKGPIGSDVVAGIAVRNAFEIILMFRLSFPEFSRGPNFGHYLSGPKSRSINVRDRFLRNPFLCFGCVENGGAVARSGVISLAVLRCRIVNLEEEFQQLPITQLLWIENDFDRFGMTLVVAIRCIRNVASGVTDSRGNHARTAAQQILHAEKQPPARTARSCSCDDAMCLLLFLMCEEFAILAITFSFE